VPAVFTVERLKMLPQERARSSAGRPQHPCSLRRQHEWLAVTRAYDAIVVTPAAERVPRRWWPGSAGG
jgi:protein-L-isoaspartate O-methyltransferase